MEEREGSDPIKWWSIDLGRREMEIFLELRAWDGGC
jgi:hypothetical protein